MSVYSNVAPLPHDNCESDTNYSQQGSIEATAAMVPVASIAPAGIATRTWRSRACPTIPSAGDILAAGAIAAAEPDINAAGPDFEAAGLDFEAARPDVEGPWGPRSPCGAFRAQKLAHKGPRGVCGSSGVDATAPGAPWPHGGIGPLQDGQKGALHYLSLASACQQYQSFS